MAIYQRLTERVLASGVTSDDLIHIVIPSDVSQDPDGSSYKAKISQLIPIFSGLTFSGGASNCITDLYVSNIHSCSPLVINPLDEGNVYFGSTSGVTIDVTNSRLGIGTETPQYPLDILGVNSRFYYDPTSLGGLTILSGGTNIPRQAILIPSYLSKPAAGGSLGIRTWDDVTYQYYGNNGDMFLYAGNDINSLNIINGPGTLTDDSIKFYAGTYPNLNPAQMTIFGTGTTKGYVGIGTETPKEKLHVSGNTIISSGLTASTLNISSTPTTDTDLPVNYLTRDVLTGEVKVKTIPGPTVYGLFAQTGDSVAVSATTVESTIIDGGVGTLIVPANGFSVGDSFRADFGGLLSAKNNDTLRIRVKTIGGVILADSLAQTMTTSVNDVFQFTVNFTIRNVGVAGVADIVSLGVFHTTKQSNGTPAGFAFNTVNNTTFDTTISNTLTVTAEWSSNSPLNSIYSDIFVLNKIY
jgi:hypothetical protein